MRARSGIAWAFCVAGPLLGCSRDADERLFVPRSETTQSALLIVHFEGGFSRAIAAGPEPATWRPVALDSSGDFELVLLEFDLSLEELELPAGEIATTLASSGRALPETELVRSANYDGALGEWRMGHRPEWLASVRLELPPLVPCLELEVVSQEIPNSRSASRIRFAVPLGGTRILIGGEGIGFLEVSPAGVVPRPELSTYLPVEDGHRLPSDEIWIVRGDHRTFHGDLERGFVEGPPIPGHGTGTLVGPGPEDGGFELFFGSSSGELHQDVGEGWTLAGTTSSDGTSNWLPMAWFGPGHVMFSTVALDGVLHYQDGRALIRLAPDTVHSISRIPNHRPIVGTKLGGVYEWVKDDEWETIIERGSGQRVSALAPIPGGILFGGANGIFRQHFFDPPFTCELESLHIREIGRMVPIDGGYALIEKFGNDAAPLEVRFVFLPPAE